MTAAWSVPVVAARRGATTRRSHAVVGDGGQSGRRSRVALWRITMRVRSVFTPWEHSRGLMPTLLLLSAFCVACKTSPGQQISVSVSPATVALVSGGTQLFTATVTGTPSHAVTWTVLESGGG